MAALYMRKRRLTTKQAATVTTTGEPAATSWAAMSCAMPENDSTERAMPSSGDIPAVMAATPATKPNGIVPINTGAISRAPARSSSRGVKVAILVRIDA